MKGFAHFFIALAMILIIACLHAEGSAMRGGARGLQADEPPEEVPQEFNHRARRAAADEEVPEEVPQELMERSRRAALGDEPEQVPQEIEHNGRFRRSSAKAADEVPEEAPQGLHGARRRRSPQMPIPDGMPPMPPMPPMPMPQRFHDDINPRVRE
ncbi:PREDICTED: uncharacterized protein LOC108370027 [Rhagoletis zephyria]|uniref:uncharacterized protein LOC108370027 n=1 Tax=Rhagoletis zephyria TaxID=28612 RepID=UPI000811671B|nr:PREDICTED: uncharacterized protein LOC108370027 [Rhagoletis zephyria]